MFQHVMLVESNRDCVLCMRCVRLCPNGSPQLNLRIPARELWAGISARPQVARFVVMLLGLLIGQALIQRWESGPPAWAWARWALDSHRFLSLTALLVLAAALPLFALRVMERRPDGAADPVSQALRWQRVTSWAPLLAGGYAGYQFGNVPGLDRLRLTLGGLGGLGLPDPLLSLRLLPAAQGFVLTAGFVLTVVTLWKIWPPDQRDRGVRWFRGQAISLGATPTYAAVLLLLIVIRPEWARP